MLSYSIVKRDRERRTNCEAIAETLRETPMWNFSRNHSVALNLRRVARLSPPNRIARKALATASLQQSAPVAASPIEHEQ
jgi:hypothetical protein